MGVGRGSDKKSLIKYLETNSNARKNMTVNVKKAACFRWTDHQRDGHNGALNRVHKTKNEVIHNLNKRL